MSAAAPSGEPLSQVIWASLGWILLVSAVGVAAAAIGVLLLLGTGAPMDLATLFGMGLAIGAGSLAYAVIARRRLQQTLPDMPARPLPRMAGAGLVLLSAAIAAAMTHVLGPVLPGVGGSGGGGAAVSPVLVLGASLLVLVGMTVLAPVAEELFFRDYLWRRAAAHGRHVAVSLTLSLWLFVHLRGPLGTLAILPLGALVTWTRFRTGSPRLGIALHAAWNAAVVLVIAAAVLRRA